MKKILLSLLLFSTCCFCQTDWQKWEAKTIDYRIPVSEDNKHEFGDLSLGDFVLNTSRSIYKFFISDLDGDNCPFYPTCSYFFVLSVKETNILKGTLMFADRFTRDLNIFKIMNHYPRTNNNRFFDPVYNYTLNPEKIKLTSTPVIIDE